MIKINYKQLNKETLLITIEGIDGSGKTTLLENLCKKTDFDLITHNWRDTELGKKIWHLLDEARSEKEKGLPSNWSYIFFILVAFDELIRKIINPNLQKNKTVLIDRYIDSTFVYQGLTGNIKVDAIQEIAQKTINLPLPDITFVLDIEPQKAQERLKKRKEETGEYTNWDSLKLDFHQRIRNNYLELKKIFPERIYVIDANKSEDKIAEEVGEIIKQAHNPKENLPKFVRVIIHNEKGEILLVKDKKWGWNLPGGKIEKNETPNEAAKREVFEETNLVLESFEKIKEKHVFYANLEKGNRHWKGHFYQASQYSGKVLNKGEVEDIKFVDLNSFPESNDNQHSWKFYLEKIKSQGKLTKLAEKPEDYVNKLEKSSQSHGNIRKENARVVVWKDEKFLLVNDIGKGWNLPGGMINKGETPLECAIREVKEETNLMVNNLELLCTEWIYYRNQWWKTHIFETTDFSGRIVKQNSEVSDINFFTLSAAQEQKSEAIATFLPHLIKSMKRRNHE